MEKATKQDLHNLKIRLDAYEAQREENYEKMKNATVDDYISLSRRQNEIGIKIMAIEDAIARIYDKGFSKNKPEFTATVCTTNPNRYAK